MSEDQFENRATFGKSYWAIVGGGGFCVDDNGFPLLTTSKDLTEADILRLTENSPEILVPCEVFVTVIEKPKE